MPFMLSVVFLTTPSSASRTLQSRFSNLKFSLLQTCGKDCNFPPGFILLTVWKITTLDESNEFPLTLHHLVGIGNSQPASFVFLSMVFAGFRTILAMNVVKIKQFKYFLESVYWRKFISKSMSNHGFCILCK